MNEHVELYRPPKRFGWAVTVWRETVDGRRQVLQWDTGTELWIDVQPGTDVEPTFYASDEVLDQLTRHWLELKPPSQPDPAVVPVLQEALADAKQVRDEHMRLVREMIPLAAKPPMLVPARSDT